MYLAPLNYDRYFKKVFSDERIAKAFLEDFLDVQIEELSMLPKQHQVTDDASFVEFDFRCKIAGNYVIIDMQQWYKPDITQRFYVYHALNSGLQLEEMPKEQMRLDESRRIKTVKDYRELEPVITLIWMVDDTLKFTQNYISYIMLPELILEFLKSERLWKTPEIRKLLQERKQVLDIAANRTKNLDFLPKNRLIFAFQKNIVRNTHAEKYNRWFTFAEKTRNKENVKEDFQDFQEDDIFAEIIRRLNTSSLTDDDLRYIEQERRSWQEFSRWERGMYESVYHEGVYDGEQRGEERGIKKGEEKRNREIVLNMHSNGISPENIAEMTGIELAQVLSIIEENDEN